MNANLTDEVWCFLSACWVAGREILWCVSRRVGRDDSRASLILTTSETIRCSHHRYSVDKKL